MLRSISVGTLAVAFMASSVSAQQAMYAQCGGIGWSGGTTCVSGASCQIVNDYYYQCLPGAATTSKPTSTTTAPAGSTPTGNPFAGKEIYANGRYKAQVQAEYNALVSEGNTALAAKVAKLTTVPVGIWIADRASVPNIGTYLQDANNIQSSTGKKQIVNLVIYDLPDRDCAAGASAGEYSSANGGEAKYKDFIADVKNQIQRYPNVLVAAVLEPDSVGNMVGNQGIPFCATAAPVHKRSLAYAISVLGVLPNVSLYLDGAHATWLGGQNNLGPTANLLGGIYASAKQLNPNAVVRGISTDVSNYNGLDVETTYYNNLQPYLASAGYPAHFIVDQGRSGNQKVSRAGADWCNFKYAGLGQRPTSNTGSSLIDAILWIKPPGESDGTSDPKSTRYDPTCASNAAYVPSPEAGSWGSGLFRSMVQNANPAL
ncbi:cellulase CEL6B [Ceratobasidium sp. AG-I]|nr:cellulase CEL6B [Ceratobasidium sp. AG-I]